MQVFMQNKDLKDVCDAYGLLLSWWEAKEMSTEL